MVGNWLTFQGKSLTCYRKRPIFRISNLILLVYCLHISRFRLETQKRKWKTSVFHQTNYHPRKTTKLAQVTPFFYKKWGLKPKIFEILVGTKINVEWACFYIYLYHINHPMENGNNETCSSLHLFSRKLRVKTTPYRIMQVLQQVIINQCSEFWVFYKPCL